MLMGLFFSLLITPPSQKTNCRKIFSYVSLACLMALDDKNQSLTIPAYAGREHWHANIQPDHLHGGRPAKQTAAQRCHRRDVPTRVSRLSRGSLICHPGGCCPGEDRALLIFEEAQDRDDVIYTTSIDRFEQCHSMIHLQRKCCDLMTLQCKFVLLALASTAKA